ncbi:hypothetical protein [Sandaracinus amylolyticus]|uniref:hypothetical protein n=1 Tax=Sandaracinus amylolyticus TaxID=927083 RepID=UPI001F26E963|nr:hypothetical protein [Sandaracinus amylolyticus]UJR80555.1 Hypothetical protein I5071_26020 [Sandaracinus amylolyticus]
MTLLDRYDAFLDATLALTPLTPSVLLRVVLRPSFQPECALELAKERDDTTLTIHTLDHSAWACLPGRADNTTAYTRDSVTGRWVRAPVRDTSAARAPVLTRERSVLDEEDRRTVEQALDACRAEPPTDDALVLDGICVVLQTPTQRWERRVAGSRLDPCITATRLVLGIAARHATSDIVRERLVTLALAL